RRPVRRVRRRVLPVARPAARAQLLGWTGGGGADGPHRHPGELHHPALHPAGPVPDPDRLGAGGHRHRRLRRAGAAGPRPADRDRPGRPAGGHHRGDGGRHPLRGRGRRGAPDVQVPAGTAGRVDRVDRVERDGSSVMEEVVVVGIGAHPWGKFPEKNFIDLGAEAVRNALADAGVSWTDVPAAVSGIYVWGGTDALNAGSAIAGRLGETGIPILNVFNMCATATSAFRSAYHVVASGEQDMCLAIGVDVSPPGFFGFMGKPDPADGDYLRFRMQGLTNPGYWAMEARKRMEEY